MSAAQRRLAGTVSRFFPSKGRARACWSSQRAAALGATRVQVYAAAVHAVMTPTPLAPALCRGRRSSHLLSRHVWPRVTQACR
eukprot:8213892-Alexandrium_andersonii.AAC.1